MHHLSLRALAASGLFVGAVCAQSPQWVDVAASSNITDSALLGHTLGRGAVAADFNGDGMTDLIFPGEVGANYRAYLNLGGWFFIDISPVAGLGISDEAKFLAPADYDNDGDLDIFVAVRGGPSRLYNNNGMMMFTEVGAAAGLDFIAQAFHATWGDYDRDGDVDLYVGVRPIPGEPASNYLFRNNGDGTFTEVTVAAGVTHDSLTFSCMWFDYDSDGWPDLFVASDVEFIPTRPGNALYRNNGNGTFTDVGAAKGFDHSMQAMGIDVTDINNDGRPCIFLSNTATSMGAMFGNPNVDGHVMLLWNTLTQKFDRVETSYGTQVDDVGWASFFLDYDNDGRQDLFVEHMGSQCALFKNTPSLPWQNVGPSQGITDVRFEVGAGYADFDNDGCVDLVQSRIMAPMCIMKNPTFTPANKWLKVKLVGTTSNRDGLGAKVRVGTVDGVIRTQWRRSGNGLMVGNEPTLHFGLGTNASALAVEVTWPTGAVQVLPNVSANQRIVMVEPAMLFTASLPAGDRPFHVVSPDERSCGYFAAVSGSTDPGIAVGDKIVPLAADALFWTCFDPSYPFAVNNVGQLDMAGHGNGHFWAPPLPELAGLVIYSAAITFDVVPSFTLRSVVGPHRITL